MPTQPVPVSCNKDCGGGCPLLAYVENGRVVHVANNPRGGDAMSGCVRGYEMPRVTHGPDRILQPLLRRGPRGAGEFRVVAWPEALDRVAEGLSRVRERWGAASILALAGFASGRGALHSTQRLANRFFSYFGGYTGIYGGYSSAAADFVTPFLLGTNQAGIDSATLRHSALILLWGANPYDTRLGCDTIHCLQAARELGTEVIVIDPRRSATVRKLSAEWVPVRPGTDAALMMAVLFVLLDESLVDRDAVGRLSVGFEQLEHVIRGGDGQPKTPEWAEQVCGTPAGVIRRLARRYGQARPAALIPGLSIQRTLGGEEAIRMSIALQVATGNLGRVGGTSGALTWGKLPTPRVGSIPVPPNPAAARVPVVRWPDAVLGGCAAGFPSDVHALYNVGSNYLVQGSDLNKSLRAFERVELAVCHDYTLTPTARWCDIILPATTFLEREDIVFPAGGNYLLYSNRAVQPVGGARDDYRIFCELADRLGFGTAYSEGRGEAEWLRAFLDASEVTDVEEFRRTGIYWGEERERVGLADFASDPASYPLHTPSGKVEISSSTYARAGGTAVPECRVAEPDPDFPLCLVTPHARFRTHSQYHHIAWFREKEPQALWMHPMDAAARGIAAGDRVEVASRQGRTRVPVLVTESIMPGVVSLLEGAWPDLDASGVDNAGSANILTSSEPTLPSQATRTHSTWVQAGRAG